MHVYYQTSHNKNYLNTVNIGGQLISRKLHFYIGHQLLALEGGNKKNKTNI